MTLQTTVYNNIGFGIVGEIALEGPLRAQPAILNTTTEANNIIGRAFCVKTDGVANFDTASDPRPIVVDAGGTGVFAGILGVPKNYPLRGTTSGGTLAPTLALPNQSQVELIQETAGMIVNIGPGGFDVGDWVYFNAAGSILAAAPGIANAPASSRRLPGGRVERFLSAASGLAVISFNSNVDPQEAA